MRRVVETTCVILHHVTHSNNHFMIRRDLCGGETGVRRGELVSPQNLSDAARRPLVS